MKNIIKKRSKKQIVSILLILTGFVLIVITFGMNLYASLENKKEVEAFREKYINGAVAERDIETGTEPGARHISYQGRKSTKRLSINKRCD